MDEFGSRIRQSCDPSVAMAVFFYIPTQLAFTVMWPLHDLDYSGGCGSVDYKGYKMPFHCVRPIRILFGHELLLFMIK